MPVSPWRFDHGQAIVDLPGFLGRIDLSRPERGLHQVLFQNHPIDGQQALAIELPEMGGGQKSRLTDCYVRGADLVATYAPSDVHPLRVQVYWRLVASSHATPTSQGIDLLVSVQTNLLDTSAQISAVTQLRSQETFRLAADSARGFLKLELSSSKAQVVLPADGPGCLVFGLRSGGESYAEMIHPTDFHADELARGPGAKDGLVRLVHPLFSQRLEKGVILRARIRGMWLSEADSPNAGACFDSFSSAPLPLTT